MTTLLLKLLLTPTLIGLASLAGRRWGPSVSGWLVALPFTSGPIILFLALNQGTAFAAATAVGILTGAIAPIAFCVAYAWFALRWRWPLALAFSLLVYAVTTVALQFLSLPLAALFLLVIAVLGLALRLLPGASDAPAAPVAASPRWDIPARMIVATIFVLLLTGFAPELGAHLTGLLAPFPLYVSILGVFAHRLQGPPAAIKVLRGLLLGLFGFASFFLLLAALLERTGLALAFGVAIAVTLTLQAGSLWVIRRTSAQAAVPVRQP